jgi:hypothetical protein
VSPAAIDKARSLHRFATEQGAPLDSFKLALTDAEALEALDWFKTQMYRQDAAFDVDLEIAHRTGNPWQMLSNFQLMGLEVVRAEQLN